MQNFVTIAYNMNWYLRLYTFIFRMLSNLAKYIGLLPLEHHHKIGKKMKEFQKHEEIGNFSKCFTYI